MEQGISNEEANVALVRRIFHEGKNVPNSPEEVAEIFAHDFICHGPPGVNHTHPGGATGPEYCMFQGAFADVAFTVQEATAEGDRVICHFTAHGVQIADFQGVKASGRPMSVRGTTTFRVEGDKVKEGWGVLIWG